MDRRISAVHIWNNRGERHVIYYHTETVGPRLLAVIYDFWRRGYIRRLTIENNLDLSLSPGQNGFSQRKRG